MKLPAQATQLLVGDRGAPAVDLKGGVAAAPAERAHVRAQLHLPLRGQPVARLVLPLLLAQAPPGGLVRDRGETGRDALKGEERRGVRKECGDASEQLVHE